MTRFNGSDGASQTVRAPTQDDLMQIRLVYTSTLNPDVTEAGITALVDAAAAANLVNDITGVLALEGPRVCQILEGPAEAVDTLFAAIQIDARHSMVNELDRTEIRRPYFQSWGMVRRPMIDIVTMAFSI